MNSHKLVQSIVEMFSTGNTSEAENVFDKNYVDHQRPDWLLENGPEEFKQIVNSARKSLPDLHVIIKDVIIEESKIAARLYWQSGNIERETLEILHIKNGKVIEHWGAEAWRKP